VQSPSSLDVAVSSAENGDRSFRYDQVVKELSGRFNILTTREYNNFPGTRFLIDVRSVRSRVTPGEQD
jgi:hypothetical protein